MQQLSADNVQDLHGDSMKAAHEINHSTFTEEVADLIEDTVTVENMTVNVEEAIHQNGEIGHEDEMLYEHGARITVGESLLLTMAFIMRHKLSIVASRDLITLLELHCPEKNKAVKELCKFREYFQHLRHPIKKHFSCPNPKCQIYISASNPKDGDVCKICSHPLSGKSFFIELPIKEQLQTILSRKFHVHNKVQGHVLFIMPVCLLLAFQPFSFYYF